MHGLNGHREKTWTAENGVHWLRDLLPEDLPQARILCWGYDANTHAADRSIDRPIIFVAHSLGGLVLKSALIHSDAARQGALAEHRSIKLSTHGILFMGTPHQGGNGVQLGRVLANVASLIVAADDRLLKHLERDSEWLQQQLGQYGPISDDFVTKFAYEEYATPTVLGHSIMVVPKASAVVPGHADAEPIVIHANHTSMVRYPSRQDIGYVTVSEHLQIMAKDAIGNIQQRWEAEARVDDARGNVNHFTLSLSLSGATETSHFVAREEELAWMHQKLRRSPGRQTVVVHGLGGMDKDGDASLAVKRWLDEPRNNRWLLIYDNYDHPKMGGDTGEVPVGDGGSLSRPGEVDQQAPEGYDIRQYLPDTDHGAVIVTTRSSTVQIGELLRLQKLRKIEDSLSILESTSGRKGTQDDAAAVALARKLDGLPLALSTAGTYLTQVSTSWGEYLQEYESAWGQLQKLSPQLLTYENRAMYSTWNISYTSIRRRSESAAMLLRLWAYFGNEDLWYELLRRGGTENGPKWLQDLTATRPAFDQGLRMLSNHGLVELMGEGDDGSSTWMPANLGLLYAGQGRLKEAEAMYERALQGYEKTWGPEHTSTLDIVNNLAILYKDQGRLKEAEAMYERALQGYEKTWGPEHTSTLDTVNNLAILYKDQGRLKEAEAMYERALQGKEKAWGPEHTSTLNTVNNLGLLYKDQGRLKEAEAMYERALQGKEKTWGPEHTSTLNTVNNLAILYKDQGRTSGAQGAGEAEAHRLYEAGGYKGGYNEKAWGPEHTSTLNTAEAMYERALQGKEKTWGPEHTSTLNTVNNLANLYKDQGRLKEAEAMYERALQGYEKAWGPEHTSTLDTVNNLANLYKDQGRLKEAEAMYERALQGYEKAWGPEHTSTLNTVNNLAGLYQVQGRLKEAEAMYERALQGYEKAWGPEHTSTLDTVNNLAILYEVQGRLKEAEAMYERALQGYEKTWGPEHTSTLDTVNNLGLLYVDQGRLKEAEAMYERALQGKEKAWGPEHTSTLDTVNNLAILYKDQGRLKEAEAMYERALQGKEKAWGPEHTSTLNTVNNLAILYQVQGRLKEAEAMYERALQGYEKAWGPEHTSTLNTVNNLAGLYQVQGRLKEAEAMYERALQGYEKAWGPEHTSTLNTVNNLAILYVDQGRLKEAEAIYERALQGFEKALGKDGVVTYVPFLKAVTNLGRLNAHTGQTARAKELYNVALIGVRKIFGDGSDWHKQLEHGLANLPD
ncbi:hypothetical protein LRP88_05493 [Fusarium phalaenopsidis]